jgi:hypothetical protein
MVNEMGKGWRTKLSDALEAYRTAFKMPINMTSYQLVYRKTCHLPIELEHKAFSAIKKLSMDLKAAAQKEKSIFLILRNGGRKPTIVPSYTRKEPRDGKIRGSNSSISNREIRYFSLTLAFVCLVMVIFIVSGKACI